MKPKKVKLFLKFLIIFRMLKIGRGESDPRITGALEVKQWLILAYNRNTQLSLSILHNNVSDVFLHIGSSLHAFYILSCWVTDE